MKLNKKRVIIGATVATLALSTGGVAYAYWTTTGSGTGSASTSAGATAQVTFSQTLAQTDLALFPGQAPQTISGTVTNPGPQSVYVNTVSATIASVTAPAATLALPCTSADYNIAGAPMSVATNLAAAGTKAFSGQTIEFVNTASNQDGCKGATVNLTFTSN